MKQLVRHIGLGRTEITEVQTEHVQEGPLIKLQYQVSDKCVYIHIVYIIYIYRFVFFKMTYTSSHQTYKSNNRQIRGLSQPYFAARGRRFLSRVPSEVLRIVQSRSILLADAPNAATRVFLGNTQPPYGYGW